jgi:hypothetical protein
MGAQGQVDTTSVVAAYLRFVALVGRLLTVTAGDSVVAQTRDDADGSAAFAGFAVVQAAVRAAGASTAQRAAIDSALFTGALKPRFPGIKRALPDPEFDDHTAAVFDDVLVELAKQELIGQLVYLAVEGPTRGQRFLDSCCELARAVTDALVPPGSSAWVEAYRAELGERFETEPKIAFGSAEREGTDDG